jgi:hypothetical protein
MDHYLSILQDSWPLLTLYLAPFNVVYQRHRHVYLLVSNFGLVVAVVHCIAWCGMVGLLFLAFSTLAVVFFCDAVLVLFLSTAKR